MQAVAHADLILWASYHQLVPAQMKRFIELLGERVAKYAATITTSIHYYDHTARNYIHAVSEDLGMRFAGAFTAGMQDPMKPNARRNLLFFAEKPVCGCLGSTYSSIEVSI